jgi:hypothetical protein
MRPGGTGIPYCNLKLVLGPPNERLQVPRHHQHPPSLTGYEPGEWRRVIRYRIVRSNPARVPGLRAPSWHVTRRCSSPPVSSSVPAAHSTNRQRGEFYAPACSAEASASQERGIACAIVVGLPLQPARPDRPVAVPPCAECRPARPPRSSLSTLGRGHGSRRSRCTTAGTPTSPR